MDEYGHSAWLRDQVARLAPRHDPEPDEPPMARIGDKGYGLLRVLAAKQAATEQAKARDRFIEDVQGTTMLGHSEADVISETNLARWWPAAEPRSLA